MNSTHASHQTDEDVPVMQVRFLLPVLPVYNIASAAALGRIWNNRHKTSWAVAWAFCLLLLAATLLATTVMLRASRQNYPGGHALHQLHQLHAATQTVTAKHAGLEGTPLPSKVHIDILPAMTGVSRFGELGPPWQYSKVVSDSAMLSLSNECCTSDT